MNADLLSTIRSNLANAQAGADAMKSEHWAPRMARKSTLLEEPSAWESFRANPISEGLDNANVPQGNADYMRRRCEDIYRQVASRVPERFQAYFEETPVGRPLTFTIDGRQVSKASLEYTYMLSRIAPYLDGVRVLIEIGAGFGGLARLLKLAFPQLRIILFDLPEAAAIQTYFLNSALPGSRFLYAEHVGDGPLPVDRDFDFMILPGARAADLPGGAVDAVINTRSMMEMDLPTVAFYFTHLQRAARPGAPFYCLNRYEKLTRLRDYPFDDRWFASLWGPWPAFIDSHAFHEIMAIRTAHRVHGGVRDLLGDLPPRPWRRTLASRVAGRAVIR